MNANNKEFEKGLEMLEDETHKMKYNPELEEKLNELIEELKKAKEQGENGLAESSKKGLPSIMMEYASILEANGGDNNPRVQKILEIMDIFFKYCIIKEELEKNK